MEITYHTNQPITAEAVADVFRRSGIRRPFDDLLRIQSMLDNANLTVTAWDGDRLVGVGRALTDFSFCCYLSDLAVDREYQRRGIGRNIIIQVQGALGDEAMLLLLAAPEAMAYYSHVGFQQAHNAWIIDREK
jgi:GNAT superfamily N-acetyltransferase